MCPKEPPAHAIGANWTKKGKNYHDIILNNVFFAELAGNDACSALFLVIVRRALKIIHVLYLYHINFVLTMICHLFEFSEH